MNPKFEHRVFDAQIEVRSTGTAGSSAGKKIVGYAAKFDTLSLPMGGPKGFREKIDSRAFDSDLQNRALDCRALMNHDPNLILGRTTSGTLRLSKDAVGLKFEIDPPNTQYARDLVESIRRGDISQCSFSFRVMKDGDEWTEDPGRKCSPHAQENQHRSRGRFAGNFPGLPRHPGQRPHSWDYR